MGYIFIRNAMECLKLIGRHGYAAECFFVQALKFILKLILIILVLLQSPKYGFFTSLMIAGVGIFAIDCFGPRGSDKSTAKHFGKMLWEEITRR